MKNVFEVVRMYGIADFCVDAVLFCWRCTLLLLKVKLSVLPEQKSSRIKLNKDSISNIASSPACFYTESVGHFTIFLRGDIASS